MSEGSRFNEVNYAEFDKIVFINKETVLVDFFADWCGPCQYMMPVISQIADEINELKFIKVNIDKRPILAEKFNVNGIPRFMIFRDGEPIAIKAGACNKSEMISWIKGAIN